MRLLFVFFCFSCLLISTSLSGQSSEFPNSFSVPKKVPHGCLYVLPSRFEAPPDDLPVSGTVALEDEFGVVANVRVRIWRIGCHEPNRSAIAMNLRYEPANRNSLGLPSLKLIPENSDGPGSAAYFSLFSGHSAEAGAFSGPGTEIFTLSEQVLFVDGVTLIVDTADEDLSFDQYNGQIDIEFDFGAEQVFRSAVPAYVPALHKPQIPVSPFNGRYSGQWIVDGLPRSGLSLQIGEVGPERNYVFAIWFTYLDGEPIWIVGNTDFALGSSSVEIELARLEGGQLMTQPGSYTRDDISVVPLGTMLIETVHCNRLQATVDFTDSGLGFQHLEFERLLRIAGYDCDQTQN